jgi:hypothetical protein
MASEGPALRPEQWFERLAAHLPGEVPEVTGEERAALLDLARVAAHTSERWTAPISTFVAGVVYGSLPSSQRAAVLSRLVQDLEAG